MKLEFKLPDLGENIEGGDIIAVLVALGDQLSEDQPVIELETDKAMIEVPSSVAGKIVDIHVNQGDHVVVGSVILTVEAENGDGQEAEESLPEESPTENKASIHEEMAPAPEPPDETAPSPTASGPVEFRLPDLGENIESGEVVRLLVNQGDTVVEDQPLIELETDKAVIEALFEVGDDHRIGAMLDALGLPRDEQLAICRSILAGGRSRATVNGRLTTVKQLRSLTMGLIDISSQHEHHSLANPQSHLELLDNYAAHKKDKVQEWLARHPRWTFHFTPTSSSWLNAVEGFFAKLTRRRLKHGVFHSVVDLQAAINRFIREYNADNPKPFIWKANPDEIIAARNRGFQTLESIH